MSAEREAGKLLEPAQWEQGIAAAQLDYRIAVTQWEQGIAAHQWEHGVTVDLHGLCMDVKDL